MLRENYPDPEIPPAEGWNAMRQLLINQELHEPAAGFQKRNIRRQALLPLMMLWMVALFIASDKIIHTPGNAGLAVSDRTPAHSQSAEKKTGLPPAEIKIKAPEKDSIAGASITRKEIAEKAGPAGMPALQLPVILQKNSTNRSGFTDKLSISKKTGSVLHVLPFVDQNNGTTVITEYRDANNNLSPVLLHPPAAVPQNIETTLNLHRVNTKHSFFKHKPKSSSTDPAAQMVPGYAFSPYPPVISSRANLTAATEIKPGFSIRSGRNEFAREKRMAGFNGMNNNSNTYARIRPDLQLRLSVQHKAKRGIQLSLSPSQPGKMENQLLLYNQALPQMVQSSGVSNTLLFVYCYAPPETEEPWNTHSFPNNAREWFNMYQAGITNFLTPGFYGQPISRQDTLRQIRTTAAVPISLSLSYQTSNWQLGTQLLIPQEQLTKDPSYPNRLPVTGQFFIRRRIN